MTSLRLSFLGTFQAEIEDKRITNFESDKARALLAYLVVEQLRPHERAKLAALFWPEQRDRTALRNLTQSLSRVRRAIRDRTASPAFLLASYQTIQFNPASPHVLDVADFSRLMATKSPDAMERAVALYHGEFLAGFHLADCPEFESWVLFRRENLRRMVMDALLQLADGALHIKEWPKAIAFATRQLELDNLHESAHRQLMLALACSGQRAAALAQFEKCCDVLGAELGVEPEEETATLFMQIRDGTLPETRAAPERAVALLPVGRATPPSLPHTTTPLLGRSVERDWLIKRFDERKARLVTLAGPGGCGKTHLALHTGHALQSQFSDGVYFVSLVAVTSHEQMIGAIADGLRLTFQSAQLTQAQLMDYLRGRDLLLILDNFEHMVDLAPLVDAILTNAPCVAILATSRERLNLHGEHVYSLGGLQVPALDARPDEIGGYGAIRLFVQSAQRSTQGFALDETNVAHVAKIVRLLQGLPLAIELAAAWVRILDCQTISEEIEASLDFLTAPYRNFPERHRSLRSVFDYSWHLATAAEKQALRRLAVFSGPFSPQAARTIAEVDLVTIRALIDKSLLQDDGAGRVSWHPLLHQYAREHQDAEPTDKRLTWRRFVDFYTAMLSERAAAILGSGQKHTLQEIDDELDNILSINLHLAASSAFEDEVFGGEQVSSGRDPAMALFTLFHFYRIRGRLEELIELAEGTTRQIEAQGDAEANHLYWYLLIFLACALVHVARYDRAQGHFERIFAYLEAHDQRPLLALCLKYRAMLDAHSGRFDDSHADYFRALAVYREIGNEIAQADILNSLGVISNDLGAYDEAMRYLELSIELNRRMGNRAGLVYALGNRGASAFNKREYADAQRFHAEALHVAREVDFRPGIMLCLLNWADAAIGLGDYEQACELASEGLELTQRNHDPRQAVWARSTLGRVALGLGKCAEAQEHFCRGIAAGMAIRVVPRTLEALVGLAQWQVATGAYAQAAELLGFCLAHPNLQRKIAERAADILSNVESQMDGETMAAAMARGRGLTLDEVADSYLRAYNREHMSPLTIAADACW